MYMFSYNSFLIHSLTAGLLHHSPEYQLIALSGSSMYTLWWQALIFGPTGIQNNIHFLCFYRFCMLHFLDYVSVVFLLCMFPYAI